MKLIKALAIAMAFSACSKKEEIKEPDTFNHANWTRIEIENGKEAHAAFGNIDDTLILSSKTSIYQTTNQGKTWHKTQQHNQPTYGFLAVKDSLFALTAAYSDDLISPKIARYADFFSLDKGQTWLYADQYKVSKKREQEYAVASLKNLTVKVKEHIQHFRGSNLVLKSTIEISNGQNFNKTLSLPFDNQINNVSIDSKGRLYVSASSAIYDKNTSRYLKEEEGQPAILYVSKKNIEQLIIE
ncbi:hypothetical protein [Pedobacter rhizosphaerae]|uniref:BNR/Asp-box repeat-containing protein n=1 Tax=Pedobacter rhizosphaerae TaxID=390241 RepID=A0A1H9RYC9_9SPHI|nr:hypothetical protein [Pedobacter rhizosphaerae]SER77737.1 hypothetical protein SAMN04488023_11631 [Pedobacter rhizosphaerae]